MMNYYGDWNGMMGGWGWFMGLGWLVWTVVGILAIVWLWKQINK